MRPIQVLNMAALRARDCQNTNCRTDHLLIFMNNRFAGIFSLPEDRAIELLDTPIDQLSEDDNRYTAAAQLAFCPSQQSIAALIRAIANHDASLDNRIARRKAIESLGKLKAKQGLTAIAGCLGETDDTYTIENAVWAIGEIGTDDGEILAAVAHLLDVPSQSYRVIIHALGQLDYRAAAAKIQAFTEHEDKTIASAAIATLYRFTGDDTTMEQVMEFLYHPNVYSRRLCIQDLIDTQYYKAIPEIARAPVSLVFRMRGLRSLGEAGFSSGAVKAEELLPYTERVLFDHPQDLQLIHAYDVTPSLDRLIQELYETDFARAYLATKTILSAYPDQAVAAVIKTYFEQAQEDYGAHYHVMKLFGWLKSDLGYSILLEGLNIAEPQFMKSRAAAALALGELGNPDAIPALQNCLNAKNWDLRFATIVALEKLGNTDGLKAAIDDNDWMISTKAKALNQKHSNIGP
jgi:bilin biosynthesis protein